MGRNTGEDNNTDRVRGRVTIAEAATLLNVHPNTVRNRVRDGTYKAEKVLIERGPTWLIELNSLITNTPTNASQQIPQIVSGQATHLVQDLLRPFVEDLGRAREELGAERVRREQAESERDDLRRRLEALEALQEPRGSPVSDEEGPPYGTAPEA